MKKNERIVHNILSINDILKTRYVIFNYIILSVKYLHNKLSFLFRNIFDLAHFLSDRISKKN